MPDVPKRGIETERVDFWELVKALMRGWKGGEWQQYATDVELQFSGHVSLA